MNYCNNSAVKQILNGDNIKHIITISDIINGIRQIVNINDVNISANYYTETSVIPYTASKINETFINCSLDSENNKLKVILEDYNLDNGLLYCNLQISIPDLDFPDGYANYSKQIFTNICLVDANTQI